MDLVVGFNTPHVRERRFMSYLDSRQLPPGTTDVAVDVLPMSIPAPDIPMRPLATSFLQKKKILLRRLGLTDEEIDHPGQTPKGKLIRKALLDIKRLRMSALGDYLGRLGLKQEEIYELSRWERVSVLLTVARSKIGKQLLDGELLTFVELYEL